MNYRDHLSEERVINTDYYCFNHEVNHKTRSFYYFRVVFTHFLKSCVAMVDDLHVTATALQCLAILGNILFSVHMPVLSGGIQLLENKRHLRLGLFQTCRTH
jgi:hypothetical protein